MKSLRVFIMTKRMVILKLDLNNYRRSYVKKYKTPLTQNQRMVDMRLKNMSLNN